MSYQEERAIWLTKGFTITHSEITLMWPFLINGDKGIYRKDYALIVWLGHRSHI